jgi:hypothetical protein
MDGLLQPPSATTFDAAASTISLLVYLGVAVAVSARMPRDARAKTFLVIAITSAVAYAVSPLQWWTGGAALTVPIVAVTAVAFSVGAIALFHFSQVFPRRRPWIAAHGRWLAAAYITLPVPVAIVAAAVGALMGASMDAGTVGALSAGVSEVLLLLAIPLLFLVGLVLPFSGVMSLFQSWQEARRAGDEAARTATFWILMSQMGGGVLSVLVLPLLHLVGVGAPWSLAIAALAYAFALLLPIAFFRYQARVSTSA